MAQETKVKISTRPENGSRSSGREEMLKKLLDMVEENVRRSPATQVDQDGFTIPEGKLPIDGHFSTQEVKTLVDLAKQDGAIGSNVHVDVVHSNKLGDLIEVSEVGARN